LHFAAWLCVKKIVANQNRVLLIEVLNNQQYTISERKYILTVFLEVKLTIYCLFIEIVLFIKYYYFTRQTPGLILIMDVFCQNIIYFIRNLPT